MKLYILTICFILLNTCAFSQSISNDTTMIVQGFIEELHIKQLISNNFTNELNSDEIQLIDKSNVSSSVLFILEITELQIKKKKAILSARHFSINNKPTVIVTAKFRKKNKRWIYHSTSLETIKW